MKTNKPRKKAEENYSEVEDRGKRLEALINLSNDLRDTEKRVPVSFNDFLYFAADQPEIVFRDIFQLFHDMVNFYVPAGVDEYKDSDSIGFVNYDSSNLFINDCDDPFFADRLFANRFMNLTKGFKKGIQNNLIYLFEGPPGSGKSTFLNNLLHKLDAYTKIPEGILYETVWRIDIEKLSSIQEIYANTVESQNETTNKPSSQNKRLFDIACPNHDHPILQIPKDYREKFLDELITDIDFKHKLFNSKEYKWVMKDVPCSICTSIYNALLNEFEEPMKVYNMINARRVNFNRQFGKGISIYNPGDHTVEGAISSTSIQTKINEIFKHDEVSYIYSNLALTNNGVYALMDIKEHNIERLMDLHGIISDGVHKVEHIEERIKSLFVGLVNPEDKVHYENVKSFQDRIITVNIPYILDYNTEVSIYKNKFGSDIDEKFLHGVLENFAKIIISSRMDKETPVIRKWIQDTEKYEKYIDDNFLLLKMEIYTGIIPDWLTEEDLKKFNKTTRKEVIAASEAEGRKGFSGRQSLNIFNTFFTKHMNSDKLITMDMVKSYFMNENESFHNEIPKEFIEALVDLYDFNVLQEIKESIYYYNEKQISRDIQNYLFAINFEKGNKEKSVYTGDLIDITEDYFKNFEAIFIGTTSSSDERVFFRKEVHNEYITKTFAQEIRLEGKKIIKTDLFKNLFERYTKNLKENALTPYAENDNFRRAINDYGTAAFKAYDDRMKRDVELLITNLKTKFNYTENGAIQISIYVLDKKLSSKY